jgi:serine/threonine protein kinase
MFRTSRKNTNITDLFRLNNRIGAGGYAVVYDARDKLTNEAVALKKYLCTSAQGDGISETTLREIGILKMCKHPNIIEILWYDNIRFKYISTRKYDYDLHSHIKSYDRPIPVQHIRDISYQMLRGVYYLHTYAIVHRDLKPQNILIQLAGNGNYRVVIIDMGLSRQFDIVDRMCPKTPDICTLWYRSPDMLLGYEHYYYDLDVWSMGCVIGEMMLRKPIFAGNTEMDQLYKIFDLLGTPTEADWNGISNLKNYKSWFIGQPSKFKEMYSSVNYDKELLDLLESMLIINPLKRPEVNEVLNNSFFSGVSEYVINMYEDNNIDNIRDKWIENMSQWETAPIHKSLEGQLEINVKIRTILLDWLVDVISLYNMRTSVYLRAQNIIDMYMSKRKNVTIKKFQLIGLGAIWISAKIEEIYHFNVEYLFQVSDNEFDLKQISKMERKILRTINTDLYFPITTTFLSTYANHMRLTRSQEIEIEFVLMYITCDLKLLKYHPSIICLCTCLFVSGQDNLADSDSDSDSEEYIKDDISKCMHDINIWISQGLDKNLGGLKGIKGWNLQIDITKYI